MRNLCKTTRALGIVTVAYTRTDYPGFHGARQVLDLNGIEKGEVVVKEGAAGSACSFVSLIGWDRKRKAQPLKSAAQDHSGKGIRSERVSRVN